MSVPKKALQSLSKKISISEIDPLVLLVEDHPGYRLAVTSVHCPRHRRICVRWHQAGSALEALNLIGFMIVPDLVVSDQYMPGMAGSELLKLIGERHPNIKRALLSGYTSGEQVMTAPYPVFAKDLDARKLIGAICKLARGLP